MRDREIGGADRAREPGSPAPTGATPPHGADRAPARDAPMVRALDRDECERFLERHRVGRLAYVHERRIYIEPLHYIYDDGWLYGRTSPGSKLVALRHNPWVAFEVDEVRGLFDWQSVVAHGAFYLLDPDGTDADVATWTLAVELLRTLVPDTLRDADPVPHRSVLFRIHVDEVSGRASLPARSW
jgi:nitroimidazol reductase NimA-like FMN-containing flavoprotein (pyridoxamine 5'-phosphate oxidase superfamily)